MNGFRLDMRLPMLPVWGHHLTGGADCFSDLDCNVGLCCTTFNLCGTSTQICPSYTTSTPAPSPFRSNTPSNSTSPTGSRNSTSSSSSSGGGGSNIGAIAGGAAGGAIAVTAVIICLWCKFWRNREPPAPASSKSNGKQVSEVIWRAQMPPPLPQQFLYVNDVEAQPQQIAQRSPVSTVRGD
eukprot:6044-Heterococcus_DN1.PRE.1